MKKQLLLVVVSFLLLCRFCNPIRAQGYKNKIEVSVAGAFQTHIYEGEPLSI